MDMYSLPPPAGQGLSIVFDDVSMKAESLLERTRTRIPKATTEEK